MVDDPHNDTNPRNGEVGEESNDVTGNDETVLPGESLDSLSPASGVEVNQSKIRVWIHEQDLESLERVLWEGEGFALLKHTSGHAKIRKFLEAAPRLMVSTNFKTFLLKSCKMKNHYAL